MSEPSKTKPVKCFRLSADLMRRLEDAHWELRVSKTEILTRALEQYLQRHAKRTKKEQTA